MTSAAALVFLPFFPVSLVAQVSRAEVGPAVDTGFSVAVLQTAIQHGRRAAYSGPTPAVVCVGGIEGPTDPPVDVLIALASQDTVPFRPLSACREADPPTRNLPWAWLTDSLSGRPAIAAWASGARIAPDGSFTVDIHYYEHGKSAATWKCRGRRQGGSWVMTACRLERIA